MQRIVLAKFQGNEEARERLLGTNQAYLVEENPLDSFWGIGTSSAEGGDRTNPDNTWGRNQLGLIVMKVRDKLRSKPVKPTSPVSILKKISSL